jgi:hypothetical protein
MLTAGATLGSCLVTFAFRRFAPFPTANSIVGSEFAALLSSLLQILVRFKTNANHSLTHGVPENRCLHEFGARQLWSRALF